ncbi:MAG: hypothetical protein HON55_01500 [Legionellales bacterium]|jgi:hypothetical protein|nr:hypothetical protein [Legionellales bacterium]
MKARKLLRATKHFFILLPVSTVLLLTGCGKTLPEKLGLSKVSWDDLSSEDRQIMLNDYAEIENIRSHYMPKTLRMDRALSVKITGGTAKLAPNFQSESFNPIMFTLKQDSCKYIKVAGKDTANTTTLQACFWAHQLWLDPSNTDKSKARFSARMFESSLWRKFTYNDIDTFGCVGFQHINVAVKLIER